MFNLTDETRTSIIAFLREKMELTPVDYTDDQLNDIIDQIVDIVKKQFVA
jgi:hypothetical protein